MSGKSTSFSESRQHLLLVFFPLTLSNFRGWYLVHLSDFIEAMPSVTATLTAPVQPFKQKPAAYIIILI
jgi:hypothetical protein